MRPKDQPSLGRLPADILCRVAAFRGELCDRESSVRKHLKIALREFSFGKIFNRQITCPPTLQSVNQLIFDQRYSLFVGSSLCRSGSAKFRFSAGTRRPQRPWFLKCASASLKLSGNISRRSTADIATLSANSAAFRTSHACRESTLRHSRFSRNGKIGVACAETVDDGTSLWKAKEKFSAAIFIR